MTQEGRICAFLRYEYLTSWCTFLLEKLIITQFFKILTPSFYAVKMQITLVAASKPVQCVGISFKIQHY